MIEKVQSFKVGDKFFNTFEEAQRAELLEVFAHFSEDAGRVVEHLVSNKEKVIDLLTMSPRSRAKARAINGAKRKRKSLPKTITASETGA